MKALIRAGAMALLCAGAAHAATVNLSYQGQSRWEPGVEVTGSGSFVTQPTASLGSIGVDDLSSFNFSFSFSYNGKVDTFSYDLSDLTCAELFDGSVCGFSAVLSATAVESLELLTDTASATYNWDQRLVVRSLQFALTGNPDMPPLSAGVMAATLVPDSNPVPEPASLALAGLALGGCLVASRRRAR